MATRKDSPLTPGSAKQCRRCLVFKSRHEFASRRDTPSGIRSECKRCISTQVRLGFPKPPSAGVEWRKRASLVVV